MSEEFDVVVVGAGPAGLTAVSLLGSRGHRVLLLERHPTLFGLPRLTHIDGETARILQSAADVDNALRDAQALKTFTLLNGDGDILVTLPWEGRQAGHPAHISMYQPDIEEAISDQIRSSGSVTVRHGWEASDFVVTDDDISLSATNLATGQTESIRAKFLVAADGANSSVRATLGIEVDDLGVNERWLNIDTKTLRPLPEGFGQVFAQCDPARPHMFMPIGTKRQRFEFAALPGETKEELEDPDRAWQWLGDTHGLGPEDVEIIRQVLYPIHARVTKTWNVANRAFLVGDAAHTMPPTIGQGACSGMRDSATLAWMLDAVLSGKATRSLLSEYETERRPHVMTIVESSIALGKVAYIMDAELAAARDAAFKSGNVPPLPAFPKVESGVISSSARLAGTFAPQGVVESPAGVKGRFDDVFGNGFHLITKATAAQDLDASTLELAASLGAQLHTLKPGTADSFVDSDGVYAEWFGGYQVDAFLVRPDFIVFGAVEETDLPVLVAELAALAHIRSEAEMGA